jgi:hypothetical protein
MAETVIAHIRSKGMTSTEWASLNPVLRLNEFGFETNTRRMKLGDGVTAWNTLGYLITAADNYLMGTVSATPPSNPSVGDIWIPG